MSKKRNKIQECRSGCRQNDLSHSLSNPKKSYLRAVNHIATYPQLVPLPAMGGYRYFFNGQEADNVNMRIWNISRNKL